MTTFEEAFEIIIGHEGGFQNGRNDPGNWTSGKVGSGTLKGTKFGISAAAYPSLNIAALTLDDARAIYKRDYWDRVEGDTWEPILAVIAFDAAINNGPARAIQWMQTAVGVPADGIIGPVTRNAILNSDQDDIGYELHALRLFFMASLDNWKTYGLGWARRLARLPGQAATLVQT
jgi:lysozyme family protein